MKLRYIISAAVAGLVSLSSCVKEDIASLDGVSAEPSYVSVGFDGGVATTIIKANEAWSLEVKDDAKEWLEVAPTSGPATSAEGVKVTFTMKATQSPRKTEVLLKVGTKEQILTVGQNGYVEPVIISAKDFNDDNVSPQGPSYYVEGFITKIEKYDYGNLYLRDDAGDEVYVYGVLDADGQSKNFTSLSIDVGDKVVLYGSKGAYNGKPQMVNATLIEVTVPAIFDLDFRAIRTMYNEKNPDKAEEYSTYTKDQWKNLFKADALEISDQGGTISIPLTFKGDKLDLKAQEVDWITLNGMTQEGDTYYMNFDIASFAEKAAPREATIVIGGMIEMEKDGKKVEKISNFELPVKQYGITPDPITFAQFVEKEMKDWVTVEGVVSGIHKTGFMVMDDSGEALYAYSNAKPDVKIGDKVMVTGEKSSYNKCYQIATPVVRVLSSKNEVKYPAPAECTDELWAEMEAGTLFTGKYITVTATPSGKYGDLNFGTGCSVSPYQTSDDFNYPADFEGKTVTLKGYVLQVYTKNDSKTLRVLPVSIEEFIPAPLAESFKDGQGAFTIEDKALPEGSTYVWKHESRSSDAYMKASAFVGGANLASESWLVSPEIDLTEAEAPKLTLKQALNYLNGKVVADHVSLMVKKAGSDWAVVAWPATIGEKFGSAWDFYETTVDLSAYKASKIQIAFKYVSTTECAPTWEVKNVVVK